ncbi:DNA repair protein RecN [Marvinbryantia sp.]|uniref:DNA repair protein RecN n=1 Tax=Marvinbryantia sp. TaxID=2496532 RepID=UPI002608051F|nr:DNA repair protein RecN [uncultured Marvinbryantia sp.]
MLLNLHVKNMALIRELEMDFGKGLNILTGETGAGKSILIGSINVALGMQSFKGFAREGADTALVELVFSVEDDALRRKIEALELSVEDGQVILSRRLSGTRSISKVNGETVPLSVVRELAPLLIDIHGQHEHQSLLYKKNHLRILDEFAREELGAYKEKNAELYAQYAALKKQMESSVLDEAVRKKEADFLQFEVEEIENAGLRAGEDEEVEAQYRKMANARRIAEDAAEAYRLTCEGPGNAGDSVSGALSRLLSVSGYDKEMEELAGQLSEIENLLSDFNHSLSSYLDDLTFDEGEFQQLENRLDEINRLKAKYGSTIDEILAYKEEKEQRLQKLADYDTYLANLEKQYRQSEERLRENSEKMSEIRSRYAKKLSQMIQAELIDLNFLETNFETEVSQTGTLSAEGMDEVCFLISMNPGSPLRPLGDVASGGELSRIMLAIKTVLAEKDDMPSLIFDEIDVGISGRTAQKVSEKMAVIAANHQVLCITHLAQIASMADNHFLIEKSVQNQSTETTIRELNRDESIKELARILGGARITDLTLQSAREMKEMAESAKKY